MRPRLRLLVVPLLLALGVAADATAQSDDGLFSVTPSRQILNDRPPASLDPFEVSNTTSQPLNVSVIPAVLDQRISGEIIFDESQPALDAAKRWLRPSIETFRLAPGGNRKVEVEWIDRPAGQPILNMGIIFQSTAAGGSSAVQTVQRLLTLNFLQLPGKYESTGRFTLLRAVQGQGKTLQFIPRIENTGEIVQSPQNGRVLVRNAKGEKEFEDEFAGDIILPDHERDFPVTMKKILPAGDYKLSASATFGDSGRIVIRSEFTLVGPNQLPSPKVALENLAGRGELGGDSEATATVHSVGTATADTRVKIQLFRLNKQGQRPQKPIKEQKLEFGGLEPDATKPLRIVYPGLPAGNYRIVATYRDTPDTLDTVEADFSPQAPKEDEGGGGLLLPVIGGAVLLGGGLFFFLWRRRRKKDEDEEGEPAPAVAAPVAAPAPAAPAAVPLVDLNTAGVDELQTLPGVGPRAAARIVEHREEYGRFASADDLLKVEGFDADRVAGLRDRVRF